MVTGGTTELEETLLGFISSFSVPKHLPGWVGWGRDDGIPPCAWTGDTLQMQQLAASKPVCLHGGMLDRLRSLF